jgi:DNA repair protein RadA/Sms
MAVKNRLLFICRTCGHTESKWLGRCPDCGSWNSFKQEESGPKGQRKEELKTSVPLSAVRIDESPAFDTGQIEFNRVLGGGLMKGSTILLGGEPGIGKSTLMLQLASNLDVKSRILYVSGEESAGQLRIRAERLGAVKDSIEVFCETDLSAILQVLDLLKPGIIIVDSIQTVYSRESGSIPGTPSQIKACSYELNEKTKALGSTLILVGHITKEGAIAGPKIVEHLVDTVLYFEQANSGIRLLRAIKNRFGSTDEIGIFQMDESGLKQVLNPASLFLEHREGLPPAGAVVAPVFEGSRVLLVEIQTLVIPTKGGMSRVFSDKIDMRKVSRTAAVLEKHLNMSLSEHDIYVNVAGGIRLEEVGIDLPLSVALYSAKTGRSLSNNTSITGEVSLAGEVRTVPHIEKRIKAAFEMGFYNIIGPDHKDLNKEKRIQYSAVKTVKEAIRKTFSI